MPAAADPAPVDDAPGPGGRRVLLIDLALKYGGTEGRVLHLAQELMEREVDVLVACNKEGMLLERLRDLGVPVAPLRAGRADPRLLLDLWRLIRRHRATVVDTHGVHSQFWGIPAAALARVSSRVVTVHSEYAVEQQDLRRGVWYESVLRATRRFDVRFIAVSVPVREYLLRAGLPDERITMIWNAVPEPEPESLGDRAATREALDLPDGLVAMVTVARLHRSKGHRYLMEALSRVAGELPPMRWLIVGEGKEEEALRRQRDELGLQEQVRFLGFRDDVPALMHASDAFVFPSLAEGLPLAVLEATLQGLPVLASAVGGLPYVYTDGEIILVPPTDVDALTEEVRRLVTDADLRESLGARGRALTREQLSTEAMIDSTLEVYDRR